MLADSKQYHDDREFKTVTIPSSGTLSDAFDTGGGKISAIIRPATIDGTNLSFQASETSDGTYNDVENAFGNVMTIAKGSSPVIQLSPDDFRGFRYFKLKSDTTETAAREFKIILIRA